MPLPRRIARFNRVVTNRILFPLALRLPHFGVMVHTGRKSRRVYRTPINYFQRNGSYAFALTYGPKSDWVRNVLANDGGVLLTRGREVHLWHPRLVHDDHRRALPVALRWIGALGNIADFLVMDVDR